MISALNQKVADLEAELEAETRKLIRKYEQRARELIPVGTPVELTVIEDWVDEDGNERQFRTVRTRTDGEVHITDAPMTGKAQLFVLVDGRKYYAYSVVLAPDDSEGGLFDG